MMKNSSAPNVKLPQSKTDMKDHGALQGKLRGKPKNHAEETPIVSGTGNMKTAGVMKENANRLAKYIVSILKEDVRSKKYILSYNVILHEGRKKRKMRHCPSVAEAIADLEECLQFNEPKNVSLNVCHHAADGQVVFAKEIPMISIAKHRPLMAEGRLLFRFAGNADRFAYKLVNEGVGSRLEKHNWGYAIKPYISEAAIAYDYGFDDNEDDEDGYGYMGDGDEWSNIADREVDSYGILISLNKMLVYREEGDSPRANSFELVTLNRTGDSFGDYDYKTINFKTALSLLKRSKMAISRMQSSGSDILARITSHSKLVRVFEEYGHFIKASGY